MICIPSSCAIVTISLLQEILVEEMLDSKVNKTLALYMVK